MDWKREAASMLENKLIPFWEGLRDRENGGYYGYMDFDLSVNRKAPKGCIHNSRILWFFATAYRTLGKPQLLENARHAYRFMEHYWDAQLGGVYWSCTYDGQPLDTMKHTYAQAFAIYGLAAYAQASGEREPLTRAMALYSLIESGMKDSSGYLEAFDRSFHPLDNAKLSDNPHMMERGLVAEKTMNTMLHVMEAYTLLYEVGRDERVRNSLRDLISRITEQVYNPAANRMEVFFDPFMKSLLDMQSFGHDIETSWLLDTAAKTVLADWERQPTEAMTTRLAQGVLERSLRNGSLINEQVEGKEDPTRIWWVQAETMVGMANLWQKTADPALLIAMEAEWNYIQTTMVDPRKGSEWYWRVDENGVPAHMPIVEPWKCPYHNGRMCMELMARL